MIFQELDIEGLMLVKPKVFQDERGFFLERYNQRVFQEHGIDIEFVQDNHSQSSKHILRGLHFQTSPFAQDKLVWVTRGEVFDVAVDLRRNSPSFGKWQGIVLSEENKHMLLIPKGFAHGFLTLSEKADFFYKTSNFYSKEHDCGLFWNDAEIGIEWPINSPILSEKDQRQPGLTELLDKKILW
jgi:dTDP-4-dehydrorhamnose 3,5-epimerase